MINCRLVEYMENNKIFSEKQCGFRRYKSTLDHLVRMDTFVRIRFAGEAKTISIFFYMEKAYDKTWRYGIMRDIHQAGLRGKLPLFINQILHNRMFQIKLQRCYSRRIQESGVAQGSTISVSLFAIKINSLSKVTPKEIHASMFVDDIQIAYSHRDLNQL